MEINGSERFGRFLRHLREQRKLSLDRVEELSHDHPERVTRSHLSRIENGQSLPTLPRLMTLSRLYGETVADMAERLEFDVQLEQAGPVDVTGRSAEELEAEAKIEAERGDLIRAFHLLEAAADQLRLGGDSEARPDRALGIQLKLSSVLVRSGKTKLAADYAEAALSTPDLPLEFQIWALMNLARIHRREGRTVLCKVLIDSVLAHGDAVPKFHVAEANVLLGTLAAERGDHDSAVERYSVALSLYRELKLPFEEAGALGGLAFANLRRRRLGQAQRFAELHLALTRKHDFKFEEAWNLQLQALVTMERGQLPTAESQLRHSNEIARKLDHPEMLFTNHFYQWRIARMEGDEARASSLKRVLRKLRTRVKDQTPDIQSFIAELGEDFR